MDGRRGIGAKRVTARVGIVRRGFTVLELMIVIALISIVAAFAYPKVNFQQFQVDAGARLMRLTMQNAQRLAVTRQYDVVVSFDLANRRMRVLEDGNNNDAVDGGERVTWHNLEDSVHFATPPVGVNGAVATSIVGSNVKTIDGMPSIVFRRDGAASSDMEIYLTSKRAKANDYRGVVVVQSTGHTDWYRYINSRWLQASF
ncbi:MAG TPA: GspH/FimT family pseudopilin [Gemmatimonadaceae bacterium]|nr:GspH/FimT family pseudopilin [Gemmatimonadaceae bacterium]